MNKKYLKIKSFSSLANRSLALRWFLVILIAVFALGCKKDKKTGAETVPPEVIDTDLTEITKLILAKSSVMGKFVADETSQINASMSQTKMVYKRKDSLPVTIFVLKVDMKDPNLSLKAMAPYNDKIWGLQRLSEMCQYNESTGSDIVAAINGDAYNTSTGEPTTVFYVNGEARKTVTPALLTSTGKVFLAYYKDKSLKIGGKDTKNVLRTIDYAQVAQAVGGGNFLIDNSAKATLTDVTISARTAIGYTADKVLYVLIADGAQPKYSNGISLSDARDILFSLGTVDAISLDGGISSTLVVKNLTNKSWSVQNHLAGTGVERSIGNGLAFVMKK